MSAPIRQRGFLLGLSAEGMAPLVAGCAPGPIGQGDAPAIDSFGPAIVERWREWMRDLPPGLRHAALSELADLPSGKARAEAVAALERLSPDASFADRALAVEYLCAIPRCCQSVLAIDPASAARILPAGLQPDDPAVLLTLLPVDAPPYAPGSILAGTAYQLGDLLSAVSGVAYRANNDAQTLTIRFPVSRSLIALYRERRSSLERLREMGQRPGSDRFDRLLDFQLDHSTPFLVHEAVTGGDLAVLLIQLSEQTHRGLAADEAFHIVEQIAEALALHHAAGLVHGDLKPANVLVSGETFKLANGGTGGVVSTHALRHTRAGSPAQRVRLARGADSLPYLSPERRNGEAEDPRDDLYSLGVLWYQLLVGDLSREWRLGAGFGVSSLHRDLMARCLGPRDRRPAEAGALLAAMSPTKRVPAGEQLAASVVSPEELRVERERKRKLLVDLKEILAVLRDWQEEERQASGLTPRDWVLGVLLSCTLWPALFVLTREYLVPTAVCVAALILVLGVRMVRRRRRAWKTIEGLSLFIGQVEDANPVEVQTWGGTQALLNPDLLPELIAAFEADLATPVSEAD